MSVADISAIRRAEINAIGKLLSGIREGGEDAVRICFSALSPSADCSLGSMSVTIEAGKDHATSEALNLVDALFLARAKVLEVRARREKAEAEAKAAAK